MIRDDARSNDKRLSFFARTKRSNERTRYDCSIKCLSQRPDLVKLQWINNIKLHRNLGQTVHAHAFIASFLNRTLRSLSEWSLHEIQNPDGSLYQNLNHFTENYRFSCDHICTSAELIQFALFSIPKNPPKFLKCYKTIVYVRLIIFAVRRLLLMLLCLYTWLALISQLLSQRE